MFQESLPESRTINGATLAFGRLGSGRSLVYLHGCDGVSLSDPFIAPLAEHFSVLAVSLPGFGDSELPSSMRSVADMARYLDKALPALGVKDAVLVGSSFGGWVAAEIALLASGLASRLVLAAPMGARFTKRPDEVEIRDIFTVPTNDLPAMLISDPAIVAAAFSQMRFADMPDGAALRYCRNREALTQFGWGPLLYNPALAGRLEEIRIPTLVIAGSQDRILAQGYAKQFADRIPGAEFHSINGAGHYVAMEKPLEFAARIVAFAGATADAAA